jgi:cyclophilin family peptidyl-prolyl cis-trans isomerase
MGRFKQPVFQAFLAASLLLLAGCGDDDPGSENDIAVVETSMGRFTVSLFDDVAPLAVENFVGLARNGYYEGVIFHRVIKGFMIQGGDPTGTGTGGTSLWGESFADEVSPEVQFDRAGYIAMANSGPDSNTSQFFVTVVPTPHLNGKHTIFGEVIDGMDVVVSISQVQTDPSGRPANAVTIEHVRISRKR